MTYKWDGLIGLFWQIRGCKSTPMRASLGRAYACKPRTPVCPKHATGACADTDNTGFPCMVLHGRAIPQTAYKACSYGLLCPSGNPMRFQPHLENQNQVKHMPQTEHDACDTIGLLGTSATRCRVRKERSPCGLPSIAHLAHLDILPTSMQGRAPAHTGHQGHAGHYYSPGKWFCHVDLVFARSSMD